jgi:hypothetical protein
MTTAQVPLPQLLTPRTQPTRSVTNDAEVGFTAEGGFTDAGTDEDGGVGVEGPQAARATPSATHRTAEARCRKVISPTRRRRSGQRYTNPLAGS